MSHAAVIKEHGGPEVFSWQEQDVPDPGPGQIRLKHNAVGLNYIDVYHRSGLYPLQDFPAVIGLEAAGEVKAVGDGVTDLKVGDRVAYTDQLGAYCEERVVPADRMVKIPDGVSDQTAAAMMLQGLTVQYLLRQTFEVDGDTTMLFHAAAGGVGLIACQWAKHLGATIIGTVGSEEKAELAKQNGCTHTINYREENFVERVKELTDGKGCDVVYDSIGKDTFPTSLDCLRPKGMWVSYGNSSGAVEDFNLGLLTQKGSLFATRPGLFHYIAGDHLSKAAAELLELIERGTIKISVNQTFPLKDIAEAHRTLEARNTTGSSVLLP